MSAPPQTIPTVSIIGAGPSGLLLARLLQLNDIPVVVYEREVSADARVQGGTLDLHEDTGIAALKAAKLDAEAERCMRGGEAEAMKIIDKDGKVWYDENGQNSSRGRPEIDRGDLRELELGSLKPGTVKWGHGLRSCVALDNDTYELTFLDETIDPVKTSILIGADGSFSRVRMILHDIKPTYSGVTMYDLSVPVERMTPELRSFVGSGSCFILNEGSAILPQMNSGGRCKVYAAVQRPAEWIDAHPLPEEGKRKWIAGMYAGWCDALAEKLIMAADEETVVARRIYGFQPGLKWDSDLSGATVIGDAAHAMPPSGEGVNQGLSDAMHLSQVLVPLLKPKDASTPQTIDSAKLRTTLRQFEKDMMTRVEEEMHVSYDMTRRFYAPDAARGFTEFFKSMAAGGEE